MLTFESLLGYPPVLGVRPSLVYIVIDTYLSLALVNGFVLEYTRFGRNGVVDKPARWAYSRK